MEKASKNKILKLLPKAAQAAVSFQSLHVYSPGRPKSRGYPGPIVSILPAKKSQVPEPTSPKVSCMGQIKPRNSVRKHHAPSQKETYSKPVSGAEAGKKPSGVRNIFSARSSDVEAPRLSQMRRFASSRDALANFDWKAEQVAPEEDSDFRSGKEDESGVIAPLSAAMVVSGCSVGSGLKAREQINLWKRRTVAQPKPLELNLVR